MIAINVKVTGGTRIEQAAKETIQLADKLDCVVDFEFNGVKLFAQGGMTVAEIVDTYHEKLHG